MLVADHEAEHHGVVEHNLRIATALLDVEIDNAFPREPTLDLTDTAPTSVQGDILELAASTMGQWRQLMREMTNTPSMASDPDITDAGLDSASPEGQPAGLWEHAHVPVQGQALLDAAEDAITHLRQLRAGADTMPAPGHPTTRCDEPHGPEASHCADVSGVGTGLGIPADGDAAASASASDITTTTTTASNWASQSGVFNHAPPVTCSTADDMMETSDCGASASRPPSRLRDAMAQPLAQQGNHIFLSSLVADAALHLTDEGQFTEDGKVTAAPTAQLPRAGT
jgi:hypothetical protein